MSTERSWSSSESPAWNFAESGMFLIPAVWLLCRAKLVQVSR